MARERCAGCFGSGKGIDFKGVCTFCGGSGTIWVPDKTVSGPVGGYGGSSSGGGLSGSARSIEELLANLLALAAFGYTIYYGFSQDWEWYWPLVLALAAGIGVYYLFMGPLRFILVLAKYAIYLGLIILFIWGVYLVWQAF